MPHPSQMFYGNHSKFGKRSSSVQSLISRGCHCIWSGHRMSFNICERETSYCPPFWDLLMLQLLRPNSSNLPCLCSTFHLEYPLVLSRFCLIRSPYRPLNFLNDDFKRSLTYPSSRSLFESRKHHSKIESN